MCGIAGAIGAIDEALIRGVQTMNDRLSHRGPDASGLWLEPASDGRAPRVALGHRRLAIIDLSDAGRQPMLDESTGNAIVFNGEVYNFAELRRELSEQGIQFNSHCDTEVILRGYAHWGEDVVQRLRGMFAFVIWNPRTGTAFFARDRLGIKPLYYAVIKRPGGDWALLFASEVRALLATGLVERRLDPVTLESYLWHGFAIGPRTIASSIGLLPPGTTATVRAGEPRILPRTYWCIPGSAGSGASPGRVDEAVDALRRELEEAVRLRLVSDVPLGIFLSGGIDSSAVAALAVRSSTAKIATFNIAFEEAGFDESLYARRVAEALGTDHHELRLNQGLFKAHLEDALGSLDQPTFDALNTYFVSWAVKNAGITVALAGTGGDELFGGYRSFVDLPRARVATRALGLIPERIRRRAVQTFLQFKLGTSEEVPPQTRWGKLEDVMSARGDLVRLYQSAYGLFTSDFHGELLAHRSRATNFGLEPALESELRQLVGDNPVLHALTMLELRSFIGERLLRDTDTASMAVALEARVPLLDHRVVESAAAIPPEVRMARLQSKQLLRDLALGSLDKSLFDRPKSGFVLPIGNWCREQLRDSVEQTLTDACAAHSIGLNGPAVARLWRSFRDGHPGIYWSRIWTLFVLIRWCRQYGVTL